MGQGNGHAPQVPKSQEEIDQEAADAAEDQKVDHARILASARENARLFIWCCLGSSIFITAVAFMLFPGPNAIGVGLGSGAMTLNLWALSEMLRRVLLAKGNKAIHAVGLMASFLLLAGFSSWMIRTFPEMMLGYGIGLSVPAVAGFVYGAVRRLGQDG